MVSSPPYAPTSSWTTCLITWTSQLSKCFRCTDTRAIMVPSTPKLLSSGWTWLQRHDRISPRPTFWRDAKNRAILPGHTQEISISTTLACSGTLLYQYPPTHRDKYTPLGFFMTASAAANPTCQLAQCTADLIQISLFFCIGSCKYTNMQPHKRTVQLCYHDLKFHDKNSIIPQNAPANLFLRTNVINLFLDNQEYCVLGESTTMEATNLDHNNPLSTTACRFPHLQETDTTPTHQSELNTSTLPPPHNDLPTTRS